jgi:hypothetical protein
MQIHADYVFKRYIQNRANRKAQIVGIVLYLPHRFRIDGITILIIEKTVVQLKVMSDRINVFSHIEEDKLSICPVACFLFIIIHSRRNNNFRTESIVINCVYAGQKDIIVVSKGKIDVCHSV